MEILSVGLGTERYEMSIEAIKHYEAALKEAFPSGATGDVFHHWNEARKIIANEALDRMAENARELGLDYEPADEPVAICPNCLGTKRPHKDDPEWKGRCDCIPPQPADEPVAWIDKYYTSDLYKNKPDLDVVPLYTRPQPAAQWVGLTDEEIEDACWTEVDQIGRAHV